MNHYCPHCDKYTDMQDTWDGFLCLVCKRLLAPFWYRTQGRDPK